MYKVLVYFTDLQDNNHAYQVGDEYPRKGLKPTQARIKELSSTQNQRRIKLIEKVEEDVEPVRTNKAKARD